MYINTQTNTHIDVDIISSGSSICTYDCFRGVSVVTGCKGDNVLQDLSVSVLQAQTLSHIAGYKSVSVFQAVKMSVCCNV